MGAGAAAGARPAGSPRSSGVSYNAAVSAIARSCQRAAPPSSPSSASSKSPRGRARSLPLQSPVPAAESEQPLEPPEKSIKVMLRTLADSLVAEVEVGPRDTVATLKKLVTAAGGPFEELQSLIWKDQALENKSTMAEIGFAADSTIWLTLIVSTGFADRCIQTCLDLRERLNGYRQHADEDLFALCSLAQKTFMMQPPLLELEAPVTICGDILGQCQDLLSIFDGGGFPPDTSYLFLGNYVNKGKFSLDTMTLLFAYKVKYPDRVFLLRGHQETAHMTRVHGFYDEMLRWYGVKLWKRFCKAFDCMPICAVVASKVFCVHGGLSPDLSDLQQLRGIERPTDVPDRGLLCDLLWSDPARSVSGWHGNDRSRSYVFGADVVNSFLHRNGLTLMCRGHGLGVASGEGVEFFANERVITICSAPNAYIMGDRDPKGALMHLHKDLSYSFKLLSW